MQVIILKDEEYRQALLKEIREATREILILTFKCDFSGRTNKPNINTLVHALSTATQRAVRVRYLMNCGKGSNQLRRINDNSAGKLHDLGIIIRHSPGTRTYHAKLFIIDEVTVFIGSHNLGESSLSRNFEVSVMIKDVNVAQECRQIFLTEWNKSKENP